MNRVWFLDTNLVANWVMARGGVLEHLQGVLGLPQPLAEVYRSRFREPMRLFDRMDAHTSGGGRDQFFVSTLALNEVVRAVKHEVVAVLAFNEGLPVSLWKNRLHNPPVSAADAEGLMTSILAALGRLQERHSLQVIEDRTPVRDDDYWDLFGPVLFLADQAETMDATLVTTAVLHGADFFVTRDKRFQDGYNKRFADATGMRVLNAQQAIRELHT